MSSRLHTALGHQCLVLCHALMLSSASMHSSAATQLIGKHSTHNPTYGWILKSGPLWELLALPTLNAQLK